MELLTPNLGLVFWTALSFLIVLFLLSKYAWKPITEALENRERTISEAIEAAEKAKAEIAMLKADNEKLLAQAREERTKIIKEAKESKETIINKAKKKSKEEAAKIIVDAKHSIDNQKTAAMIEVKNMVGLLAIEISEKILKKELSAKKDQEEYVNGLVDDMKLN